MDFGGRTEREEREENKGKNVVIVSGDVGYKGREKSGIEEEEEEKEGEG